jgi:hypothetical protein
VTFHLEACHQSLTSFVRFSTAPIASTAAFAKELLLKLVSTELAPYRLLELLVLFCVAF